MKRLFVVIAFVMALSIPVFGASATKPAPTKTALQPALPIALYPGSTQVMDITLGEKDLLNWFTSVLPAMAAMSAGSNDSLLSMINKLDLMGLSSALQGLKQVKVVELDLPKRADNSAQKVTDYYTSQLEKETGWTRVYWRSDDPQKSMAIYSRPEGEGIFVTSTKINPNGGGKLMVGRTSGKVDLAKVIQWAVKNASVFESMKPAPTAK